MSSGVHSVRWDDPPMHACIWSACPKVTTEQFGSVWKELGVPIADRHIFGIFNKYGQDKSGRMPVLVGCCKAGD